MLYDEAAENAAASNPSSTFASSEGGACDSGGNYSYSTASAMDYLYTSQRSGGGGEEREVRG